MFGMISSEQSWHYPMIARVLLNKHIYYHVKVIECIAEHPWFTIPILERILRISAQTDWTQTNLHDITRARSALASEVHRVGVHADIGPVGFLVSVWPAHGDIMFARENLRTFQFEFAQSA